MNRLKFISAILLLSFASNAAIEKTYKSKVDKAIVYLQGAQLFHTIDALLPQGASEVVIEGVSPYLDQQSLQASGKGFFTIVDVHFNIKYPEEVVNNSTKKSNKFQKQLKAYGDSISEMDFLIVANSDKKSQFDLEKNLLLSNRLIKGEFKRDSLAILKDAMDYLRSRMANINAELLKVKREAQKLNDEKERLNNKFTELQELANKIDEEHLIKVQEPIYQAIVSVFSEVTIQAKISINYYVANASWTPDYELRASNTESKINLIHKANIQQNSGVEWNEVKLILSTGNPTLNNNKPELTSFYISYYQPQVKRITSTDFLASKAPQMNTTSMGAVEDSKSVVSGYNYEQPNATTMDNFTEVLENRLRTEYNIDIKYSIASDAKNHQVTILKKEVNANYELYAAPKLDKDAFLLAKITNWEELNLLPGNAKVYFDGSYIGKTYINVNNNNDTLALNLGRDNSINVIRKKLKDKCKFLIASNDKILTQTFSITLRNTKQINIDIVVEDMLPLSSMENIIIKPMDIANAKIEDQTGRMTWYLKLKAHETKSFNYNYEVRFPKDKLISGL